MRAGLQQLMVIFTLIMLLSCNQPNQPAIQRMVAKGLIHAEKVQAGYILFQKNCASCHTTIKDCGDNMVHVVDRWGGDTAKLKTFIRNPEALYGKRPLRR